MLASGHVIHNIPYIKSKGHVEVNRWIVDTVLRHGAYRFDHDSRGTHTRFNAFCHYGRRQFKAVFEIVDANGRRAIYVITAYEVDAS